MKTSQGELKDHYMKTGEATYPNLFPDYLCMEVGRIFPLLKS